MKTLVLLNKADGMCIGNKYKLSSISENIVRDYHGEYDNHKDKLTFKELYTTYEGYAVIKVIGTEHVSRRNIANTNREVFLGKICITETLLLKVQKKIIEFIQEIKGAAKHPLFWIGLMLIANGVTQFLIQINK